MTVKVSENPAGLVLQVSDTGVGIAPGDLATVLEQFGRVESQISRKHKGSGLGLPLARQLVELHGGSLAIASTENTGTDVTITIPQERVLPLDGTVAIGLRTSDRPLLAAVY